MKTPFVIALCAGLILSGAAQAGEININQRFSGNGHPTMVDTNGDGNFAAASTFYLRGSPGRAVMHAFAEFTPFMPYGTPGCDLRAELVYENVVETFDDGSMIFYMATSGFNCVDFATGKVGGQLVGIMTGGTGRFEGASGTFVVDFEAFVVGGGMIAFAGTHKGTIVVPSD